MKFAAVFVFALLFSTNAFVDGSGLTRDQALEVFERIKKLEGRWEGRSTKGWENWDEISVIAGGSVVMSNSEFKDESDLDMSTMFHLDGDLLKLTHYCMAGNQPTLVATSVNGNTVTFEFASATNLRSRDQGHMDKAIYIFDDENTFTSQWTWYENGKERWMEKIEYKRLNDKK